MSRIGKLPIQIPSGVTVTIEKRKVTVKGPKGELSFNTKRGVNVEQANDQLIVTRENELKTIKALHGTTRSIISNHVTGVTKGFVKDLELVGVGYRVKAEGKNLVLSLGLSHPVIVKETEGIVLSVEGQNKIKVEGIDKHKVGQVAANIRSLKPPEPYKGKGIKYSDEIIIKKAGKAGKAE